MLPTDDKERKALPIFRGPLMYFPDAIAEVARVCKIGNDQHNPGEPLHWARGKSMEQMDTAIRHMMDHGTGNTKDSDGAYHMAKAAWRCLAELQLTIERERAAAEQAEQAVPVQQQAIDVDLYFNNKLVPPAPAEDVRVERLPPSDAELLAAHNDRMRQLATDQALANRGSEPNVHYIANPRQERDEKSRP